MKLTANINYIRHKRLCWQCIEVDNIVGREYPSDHHRCDIGKQLVKKANEEIRRGR